MIIHNDGSVNLNYIQKICQVFFPGSKFSSEKTDANDPELFVKTKIGDSTVKCSVKLSAEGKKEEYSEEINLSGNISKDLKTAVGIAVFTVCNKLTGYEPPWGLLTGVRPVKLAADYLKSGHNLTETSNYFINEYKLNPKKARLVTKVGSREIQLLKNLTNNNCALYISIPFCPSRCAYCSFVSYFTNRLISLIPDYLEMLCKDIKVMTDIIKQSGMFVSDIYIGGGTPSILSNTEIEKLMTCISSCLDITGLNEFTFEAGRPDTITKDKLKLLSDFGINRISINPQTLNDSVLEEIGRKHSADDFYKAYDLAKSMDKFRINTDIIAGLPGESFASFSRTVDGVLELMPENFTVHSFCVKKSSDFLRMDTDIYSRSGGSAAKCIGYADMKARKKGYSPYYLYRQKNTVGNLENTGFTLDNLDCMYNIYMMQEVRNVFACGAGAITRLVSANGKKLKRFAMPKYPYEYLMPEVHDKKMKEEMDFIKKFGEEESFFESAEQNI